MRLKKLAEYVLRRYPPLFRLSSQLYHQLNDKRYGSFRTLSPGAIEALFQAFQTIKGFNPQHVGDYYEFGLFRGYTFLAAQRCCQQLGIPDTHFYGFDSFAGLPTPEGVDQTNSQFYAGQFACSKEAVTANLTQHGIDWSRATLIEGFYAESLTEELRHRLPFKKVGVAFLDCSLYASTKAVLDWLAPLLAEHSIVLFDDWYAFGDKPELGQQRAFHEFLAQHAHFRAEPFLEFRDNGTAFMLHASSDHAG